MTLPYVLRLLCLCLACFFILHLIIGLFVSVLSAAAVRAAERIRAGSAARVLLALRLAPAGLTIFLVAGLCVPSYLWLEPDGGVERVRWELMAAGVLGMTLWAWSIARGMRAVARSRRYAKSCEIAGQRTFLAGEPSPACVVDGTAPVFALTGIVRPKLVISREIVETLSSDQLAAALQHEHAHRISRDNLKRLMVLLTPDILPFFRGFGALEHGWARFTEWAADDKAVSGNSDHSISLAAALVRVARMRDVSHPPAIATSLMANGRDLEARVNRLLRERPEPVPQRVTLWLWSGMSLLGMGFLLTAMLRPATLSSLHSLFELLIQ